MTNGGGSLFKVFDKEGNLLMGPISMNILWGDFNGQGFGDPVILWDPGAERWVFTEFGSFGEVSTPLTAAVPEPAASMLLLVGVLTSGRRWYVNIRRAGSGTFFRS